MSIKKSERRDVTELLLKMDDRFGEVLSSFDSSIQMYGQFNETSNLIFKVSYLDWKVLSLKRSLLKPHLHCENTLMIVAIRIATTIV